MIVNPYPHLYLVVEGIDGVGKTTLTRLLVERLSQTSSAVRFEDVDFKNPTKSLKRGIEAGDQDVSFLTYVLSALYKDLHLRGLLKHQHVVADRSLASVFAHHAARGVDVEQVDLSRLNVLRPDYGFLLTADEPTRRARLQARGRLNTKDLRVNEPGSELARIEEMFKHLVPIHIDTTTLSPEEVLERLWSYLPSPGNAARPPG